MEAAHRGWNPDASLDDNQSNLSVQSHAATHTLYKVVCVCWIRKDHLNGSNFLEQWQSAIDINQLWACHAANFLWKDSGK